MPRQEREFLERLGPAGLVRVLDDLLDHPRLVRLANSCGLKYPGMRTQSQERTRIVRDLAKRAAAEENARKAIFRALQKETRAASREWTRLDEDERTRRLQDETFLKTNGNLGRHLFLLAWNNGATPDGGLDRLLDRLGVSEPLAPSPEGGSVSRGEARLAKKVAEQHKKLQHLEAQLARSREAEKNFKRDLIQRKGDLAEARILVERLRTDLAGAQAELKRREQAKQDPAGSPAGPMLERLQKAVTKLTAEHKKLGHRVEKLAQPATKTAPPTIAPESLQQSLAQLEQQWTELHADQTRDVAELTKRTDALMAELRSLRKTLTKPHRRSPAKHGARLGVFVDVQNVYYGARRLKGKLDFDALLQAVVGDRRLIQATAYVVESKEIDQSGFIALLQQRGMEVRRKTLKVRADGSTKGDWDMELALDILDATPQLDVVVLVSGDGDFTSLVKRVKRMGPRVEVVGFPRNTAKSLLEAADDFLPLDRKLMIYPQRPKVVSEAEDNAIAAPAARASSS